MSWRSGCASSSPKSNRNVADDLPAGQFSRSRRANIQVTGASTAAGSSRNTGRSSHQAMSGRDDSVNPEDRQRDDDEKGGHVPEEDCHDHGVQAADELPESRSFTSHRLSTGRSAMAAAMIHTDIAAMGRVGAVMPKMVTPVSSMFRL